MAVVIMFPPGMQRLGSRANEAAHATAKAVAADIKENMPVRTGALRRSVRARKLVNSSRVYVGTDYWYYIEYGTEPHLIFVRPPRRSLADKVRRKFFGPMVNHPGIHAQRPIRRAFYKKRNLAKIMIVDDLGPEL